MKNLLVLAVVMMAASSMTAEVNPESAQNLKVSPNVDFQIEQKASQLATEQAVGLVRKNVEIAEVGASHKVMVTPEQSAFYYNPSGTFFFGASLQARFLKNSFMLAPTYVELEWRNATGNWANEFQWDYVDPDNSSMNDFVYLTSNDRNLITYNKGLSIYPAPLLTARGSGNVSGFGFGGPVGNTDIEANGNVLFGGSVSSLFKRGLIPLSVGSALFDTPKLDMKFYVMNADQDEFVAGKDRVTKKKKVKGFLNAIDKPASPYFIDAEGIWAFARVSASDDAEFTCTLYRISFNEVTFKDGSKQVLPKMEEEICHSTKSFGQLKQTMRELETGRFTGSMVFNNFVTSDEYGYETDVVPIIDHAMAVVISGFESDKVTSFELATNGQPYDQYGQPDRVANSRLITHYYVLSEEFDPTLTIAAPMFDNFTLAIMMDACFPWLHSDETAFDAPAEGGLKSFNMSSYFGPAWSFIINDDLSNIKSVDPHNMNTTVQLNDWLVARVSRGPQLTFTAAPLPAGVSSRTAKVTVVDLVGLEQNFWIAQRDGAGVEGVDASLNTVKVVDGNIEVSSASATAVEVFNVAGQKVAAEQFEGQCTLNTQDLANGMYIVKFNDNTVVKVMK